MLVGLLFATLPIAAATTVHAQNQAINEMSLDRWAKLREVERHQIQVAEKYYRDRNWSVAADEYDKFLTLYETSEGASYALLRWSLCQVQLRRQNTAIDDGFRSVIDYWPESDDAIAAAYYVGKTFKDIGQIKKAKTALRKLVDDHSKHLAGVYAMARLSEIAEIEKDDDAKLEIWRRLTFDAARNKQTQRQCNDAAAKLAAHLFANGGVDEAVKALDTVYDGDTLNAEVARRARSTIHALVGKSETTARAHRLADEVVAYLSEQQPTETDSDETKSTARSIGFLIIDIQQSSGRDDKVQEAFTRWSKRFGTDDELLQKLADWFKSKEQFDKARQTYRKMKDRIRSLSLIAASYRAEKETTSAIETYAQLATADSENAVKWKSESAWTYREAQEFDQAVAIYQELVQQDAAGADKWLWETAATYRDASKWKDAIGFFRQTDRFPDNYREMAACHRRLKQQNEAVILYNQIAGGHKTSAPWAMLQIGYTEEEASNKDKAIAAFKRVCKLFPKDHHASRAHAHLQTKYKLSVTLGGAKDQ